MNLSVCLSQQKTREVANNETLGGKLIEEHKVYFKAATAHARERATVWDTLENVLASKFPSPPLSSLAYVTSDMTSSTEAAAVTATVSGSSGGGVLSSSDWFEDPLQVFPCRNMSASHKARRIAEQDNLLLTWRKRCQFEASNQQRLPYQEARKRAVHTFEQCVSMMRFYPEVWYQYAQYELNHHLAYQQQLEEGTSVADHEDDDGENDISSCVRRAGAIYRRALVALPGCTLLYVAYAECMEGVGELDSARAALITLVLFYYTYTDITLYHTSYAPLP